MYSKSACFIPITVTSQPASLGVCASMRRAMALNSACACAMVMFGFSRAMTPKSWSTRLLARSCATGHGTYRSQGSGCQKSAARTPITVYGSLFMEKVLPMTLGSAPKRRFQNPLVRTATG